MASNRSALKLHKQRQHGAEGGVRCNVCNEVFACRRDLNAHLRKHLSDGNNNVDIAAARCDRCQKTFNYVHNLHAHQLICQGNGEQQATITATFECRHCQKRFSDKRALIIHEQATHDKVEFKCPKCNNSYKYRTNLSRHMKNCT